MRNAAILGYGAVLVGIYQRVKDGSDPPLEHELAVKVVLDLKHVFHGSDERGIGLRRDHPVVAQVRLEVVFLRAPPTVLK